MQNQNDNVEMPKKNPVFGDFSKQSAHWAVLGAVLNGGSSIQMPKTDKVQEMPQQNDKVKTTKKNTIFWRLLKRCAKLGVLSAALSGAASGQSVAMDKVQEMPPKQEAVRVVNTSVSHQSQQADVNRKKMHPFGAVIRLAAVYICLNYIFGSDEKKDSQKKCVVKAKSLNQLQCRENEGR